MAKDSPTLSPETCYQFAEAVYRKDSRDYIASHCPGAKQLNEAKIRGWRFILVEQAGDLAVSFQGTDFPNLGHWCDNAHNKFFLPKRHLGMIQRCLKKWERKYGKPIPHHIGHSAGGYEPSLSLPQPHGSPGEVTRSG